MGLVILLPKNVCPISDNTSIHPSVSNRLNHNLLYAFHCTWNFHLLERRWLIIYVEIQIRECLHYNPCFSAVTTIPRVLTVTDDPVNATLAPDSLVMLRFFFHLFLFTCPIPPSLTCQTNFNNYISYMQTSQKEKGKDVVTFLSWATEPEM